MSSHDQFGALVSTHKGTLFARPFGALIGLFLTVGGAYAATKALLAGEQSDVLLSAGLALGGLLVLGWRFYLWRQTLLIHQRGFVLKRLGQAPIEVAFEQVRRLEITRVRKTVGAGLFSVYDYELLDGRVVRVTSDIEGVDVLKNHATPKSQAPAAPSVWG